MIRNDKTAKTVINGQWLKSKAHASPGGYGAHVNLTKQNLWEIAVKNVDSVKWHPV